MKNEALFNTLKAGLGNGLKMYIRTNLMYFTYKPYKEQTKLITGSMIDKIMKGGQYNVIKPYLFSTEDLVNEIEFNGEKFVPLIKLVYPEKTDWDKISIEEFVMFPKTLKQTWYKVEHSELGTVLSVNLNNLKTLPYSLVEKLISWHFNVFDLPEDQYIRVTNENSPYK